MRCRQESAGRSGHGANSHARYLIARQQAFEAATLLVLRSKELGLPYESWLERARGLAAPDGSSSPALAIADAIPLDPSLPEAVAAFVQARREALAKTLAGPAAGSTRERAAERQERAIKDVEGRRQDVEQALQTLERATGSRPSEP